MSDLMLMLLPGSMYFWVLFVGQGSMQEVLQERESQILPRILACPVTPGQYILAKMLRCFALCTVAVILLLISSALLFHMSWGHPLKLAAVVVAWTISMTGLVAMIFAFARTREQANVLSPVVLLLLAMLGGSMFPYENLPGFLQFLGQFTPTRWAVILLQGAARSKPLVDLARPMAGLFLLGIAGSALSFLLFKRQLARGGRK